MGRERENPVFYKNLCQDPSVKKKKKSSGQTFGQALQNNSLFL